MGNDLVLTFLFFARALFSETRNNLFTGVSKNQLMLHYHEPIICITRTCISKYFYYKEKRDWKKALINVLGVKFHKDLRFLMTLKELIFTFEGVAF